MPVTQNSTFSHNNKSTSRPKHGKPRHDAIPTASLVGTHEVNPYIALANKKASHKAGFGKSKTPKVGFPGGTSHKRHTSAALLIAIACVAVLIVGFGSFLWAHRSVAVTVNDKVIQIGINSSLEDVIKAANVPVKAGNLVSVSGTVLEEGKGYSFSAKQNDTDISDDQLSSIKVSGNEVFTVGDGHDKTEDYDATEESLAPQLTFDGTYGAISYVSQWPRAGVKQVRHGKRSGETTEVVTQEAQNMIVRRHNVKPNNDEKLVALTFDDGPSSYTQRYLDILTQYGIHGTFFNLGNQVEKYPEEAKAIVAQGSQVASHSYTHPALSTVDATRLQDELSRAKQRIADTTGVNTTMFRPPYGDFTNTCWLYSQGVVSIAVNWNQDTTDWKRPGVDAIVANALANMHPGSIILMHDGGGNRDQDVEALPQIITKLQDQGYRFVTINELLASDSSISSDIASGNAQAPDGVTWPTEIGA